MIAKQDKFKSWLSEMGAVVLDTTNPYELVRFKTENGVSVIYEGKKGVTFTGESEEAYDKFTTGKKMEDCQPTAQTTPRQKSKVGCTRWQTLLRTWRKNDIRQAHDRAPVEFFAWRERPRKQSGTCLRALRDQTGQLACHPQDRDDAKAAP